MVRETYPAADVALKKWAYTLNKELEIGLTYPHSVVTFRLALRGGRPNLEDDDEYFTVINNAVHFLTNELNLTVKTWYFYGYRNRTMQMAAEHLGISRWTFSRRLTAAQRDVQAVMTAVWGDVQSTKLKST